MSEDDADYAAAQQRAADCLSGYADAVLAQAAAFTAERDYPAAIALLRTGNRTLEEYSTFSPAVDEALTAARADYEEHLLTEARTLSELKDNRSAAELIRGGMEDYALTDERMERALETYLTLARADTVAAGALRAQSLYDKGEFSAAFAELDTLRDTLDGDDADVDAEIRRAGDALCRRCDRGGGRDLLRRQGRAAGRAAAPRRGRGHPPAHAHHRTIGTISSAISRSIL